MRSGTQWPGEFFGLINERVLAHASKPRGRFASVVTDWTLQQKLATKEKTFVCLRISCWAVTPSSALARPRRPAQPMPNAGEVSVSTDVNDPGLLPALRF